MRRPRRDMSRPQAPVPGYGGGWELRWRAAWGRQRVEAKGLSGMAAMNEMFKAIYGNAMPPGSPPRRAPPRHPFGDLFPLET